MQIRELAREEWPQGLLEIPKPPAQLWLRGTMPPREYKRLAVVGSRALSRYGKDACERLILGLAGYPVSIVSGLALGADACAHKAALLAGLHTIAMPGSGIADAVIGPRANYGLAQDILKAGGALLGEHAPDFKPYRASFPERNRLMVGLSDAVFVIEAGQKSGTLITARLAGEYNRDLLVIPHRIGDPHGFGPHLFARLGAALVTEPLHILEALGIPPREAADGNRALPCDLSEDELAVWHRLEEPQERDEILRAGKAGAADLMTALVSLELRGLIKEEFGAWRRI